MSADAILMREVAEALIASSDAEGSAGSGSLSSPLAELRPGLLTLIGRGGLRALFARAILLASRSYPSLRNVTAKDDGTFSGLDRAGAMMPDSDFREVRASLLTEVLLLLLQFLGPGVTLAIIRDAWPNAALDDIDLSQTGKS